MFHYSKKYFLYFFFYISFLLINQYLKANPIDDNRLYEIGLENFYKQKYSIAADYLGQAADLNENNVWARYYYVYSLVMLGKRNEASKWLPSLSSITKTKHYEQLLDLLNPKKEVILKQTEKKDNNKTKEIKGKIVAKTDDIKIKKKENPILKEASDLIDTEKYDQARNLIYGYLRNNPSSGEAYRLLGFIDFNNRAYSDSINNLQKAFERGVKDPNSYFLAAESAVNIQKYDEAIKYYEYASKLNPKDLLVKLALADMYTNKSYYDKAKSLYEEILKSDSNIIEANVGLANIELEKGFTEKSLLLVNSILSEHEDNAKAHFLKSQIYLKQKDYVKALEEAKTAYSLNKLNIEYKVQISLVKIRNFITGEAIKELHEILKEYPDNVYALSTLGEAYFTEGKEKEGKEVLNKAEKIKKIPYTAQLLALIEFSSKNFIEAEKNYKEFCKRTGNNPESLLEYAEFIEVNNDFDTTINAYNNVIEKYPNTPFAEIAKKAIEKIQISGKELSKRHKDSKFY